MKDADEKWSGKSEVVRAEKWSGEIRKWSGQRSGPGKSESGPGRDVVRGNQRKRPMYHEAIDSPHSPATTAPAAR